MKQNKSSRREWAKWLLGWSISLRRKDSSIWGSILDCSLEWGSKPRARGQSRPLEDFYLALGSGGASLQQPATVHTAQPQYPLGFCSSSIPPHGYQGHHLRVQSYLNRVLALCPLHQCGSAAQHIRVGAASLTLMLHAASASERQHSALPVPTMVGWCREFSMPLRPGDWWAGRRQGLVWEWRV